MRVIKACGLMALGLLLASRSSRADDAPASLTEHQKAVHVLNRLAFGPKPGDVERVEKMGVDAYIRQQLHPETIDDSATTEALSQFDALSMSSSHLLDSFFADVKSYLHAQMMAGNADEMKLRYGINADKDSMSVPKVEKPKTTRDKLIEATGHDAIRAIGELQQAKLIRATMSERQLNEVLVDFWSNHFNIDVKKAPAHALKIADDRDVIRPHVLGKFRDLLGASAHSPAMLFYLDNNENSVARDRSRIEKTLANLYVSYKLGMKSAGLISEREGPNENYGRELLELHTLGVDGGYTQKDVQEVARCFTGWNYSPFNGNFHFEANRHDEGVKVVLGHTIAAGGGEKDGEQVLDILASHPATAHHISYELCQRFVADDPPAELVDHVAHVFTETDGDLRKVVEAIVASPEFFSLASYRSKIKSPLEFAVSSLRATDGQFIQPISPVFGKLASMKEGSVALSYDDDANATRKSVNRSIRDMGEPLFGCSPPSGYSEVSKKWVSPAALIDRLNFALALTQQNVIGVKTQTPKPAGDADAVVNQLADAILHEPVSPATMNVIEQNAVGSDKTVDAAKVTAMILGSPEFQRR